MSKWFFVIVSFFFFSANAAVENFEICNPNDSIQKVSIELKSDVMTVTIASQNSIETQKLVIEKSVEAGQPELDAVASANLLKEKLMTGTVYLTNDGAYLIAKGTSGKIYLFLVMGGSVLLLGDTSSCP